jgi:hypothetical protein
VTDKPSFEERLRSGEGTVSLINEPIDYTVNFAVEAPKAGSAAARARQRWHLTQEEHEP